MNEENQTQPANANNDNGNFAKSLSTIEQANAAAERMEEANKKREELILREEEVLAKKILGGRAEAGQSQHVETEDEKWAREAKVRYAGTGMDPTL